MKAWLLCLLAVSSAAWAQGEGEVQPDPNAQTGSGTPAYVKPQVKLFPEEDKPALVDFARHFFTAITLGEPHQVADMSALPFQLEDRRLNTEEEFVGAWQKAFRGKNTGMLTVYGIEVFTAAEMEKKYGKPPPRLANFPWKKPATYVVVANVSGRAAVAVFQKTFDGFIAIAYHD